MPRWAITVTHVYLVTAPSQGLAVAQFEAAHPGAGASIVKVELLPDPPGGRDGRMPPEIPTTGDDDLFLRFQHGDRKTLYDLQSLAMGLTMEELQRFCEGSMNALVVVQDQFMKRFPREFADWEANFYVTPAARARRDE